MTLTEDFFFLIPSAQCNIKLHLFQLTVHSSLLSFLFVLYHLCLMCCLPLKRIKKLPMKLSSLSGDHMRMLRYSLEPTLCHVLERLCRFSYFHLAAGTIAWGCDLIKSQSEEGNKVSGGRLLHLRLLTSPLWTNLWDSPRHTFIHWLAIKALNCCTKASHGPGFVPPLLVILLIQLLGCQRG